MRRSRLLIAVLIGTFGAAGCGSDGSGTGDDAGADASYQLQQQSCPGDPACPDQGDGSFHASAVVVDVTPTDLKEGPTFIDNNGNGEWDRNEDDYTDLNGNGSFDAVWIAGFGSRPATGVHDPITARIVAMRHNETTLILISADFVGFFYDHIVDIENLLPPGVADQVDKIILSSTHNHEGPDMVGIWGSSYISSGFDPEYMAWVQQEVADGIGEAVAALEPAHIVHGAIEMVDANGTTLNLMDDSRDPVIINTTMNVMRLFRPSDDSTIATLINFGNHPEVLWDENPLLSADFPHYLRQAVEDGIPALGVTGVGGVAVYFQGTCGGLITTGHTDPIDDTGTILTDNHTFEAAEAFGHRYAEFALAALDPLNGAVVQTDPHLMFRSREIFLRVDNFNYQAAYRLDIFARELFNWNPDAAIDETNTPDIISNVVYLQIGHASLITMPGEAAPEVFIGCYDGSCSAGFEMINPNSDNPPDLSQAPQGPFLRDILRADGSQFQWLLGLGQDEVGYILPNYNYQLHATSPYLFEADGDHYEETNSLGPLCHDQIVGPLTELIQGH